MTIRETNFPLPKSELFYYDSTTGTSKPLPVSSDGRIKVETSLNATNVNIGSVESKNIGVTFQNATEVAGEGAIFEVGSYKNLRIEIWGTSTTRTVEFYGLGGSGTKRPLLGVRSLDLEMATNTTGNDEFWEFYIEGLEKVIMEVTAVTGGDVNIKGKAVS